MKKLTKIKNRFTLLTNRVVQHLLRLLQGRNGWKWVSGGIVMVATLVFGLLHFTATQAITTTLYANGDVTKGWPDTNTGGGTCGTTANVHYTFVDETGAGCGDYVGTGTNGTTGEVEEFDLTTVSVVSATQIQFHVEVDSILGSTADTLSINLRVNGVLATASVCTMTGGTQTCNAAFSGSWDQAAVDSMRVMITRNRQGSGQQASQDDDIRLHRVYATLTYTAPTSYEQSSYRWFSDNQDALAATYIKDVSDAASTTGYVTNEAIASTSDGGYVTVGYLRNGGAGIDDALITRYDSSGTPLWSRTIAGSGNEYSVDVTATSDGGVAIAGTTETHGSSMAHTPFVAKFDASGDLSWMRVLNGDGTSPDFAEGIASAGDGGVYFTGKTLADGSSGNNNVFVGRFDVSGNLTWLKIMGGAEEDAGSSIAVTSDGVIVAGSTATYGQTIGTQDGFIAKFATDGTFSWMRRFAVDGASSDLYVDDVVVTSNGGIMVTGNTNTGPGGGLSDGYVAKFDSDGTYRWMYGVGSFGDDYSSGLAPTSDGGAVMAGRSNSYGLNGDFDAYVARITDDGATSSMSWMTALTDLADDESRGVIVMPDSGYVMSGNTLRNGGSILLARLTSTGSITNCTVGLCDYLNSATAGYNSMTVIHASVASPSVSSPVNLVSDSVTPTVGVHTAVVTSGVGTTIDVGSALAAQDTAATAPAEGTTFRLRLNLHISGGSLTPAGNSFKLQFANKGVSALCSSVSSGSYADVTATSTGIRYANNAYVGSGIGLTVNANDPTHSTDTVVPQTYQEGGAFTATTMVSAGQDGMWDFGLISYHALENTRYCFRVVDSNGNLLNSYTSYPEIIMPAAALGQASYRWFDPSMGSSVNFGRLYGGTAAGSDQGNDVVATSDGGYAVTGYTRTLDGSTYTAFIAKYNSTGDVVWMKTLGANGDDQANGIALTPEGDFVITGYTSGSGYGAGGYDAFIAKFLADGTFQWMQTLGFSVSSGEYAEDIAIDASGNIAIVGRTSGYTANTDTFIAKFSSAGAHLWTRTDGSSSSDDASGITVTSDGGFAIVGTYGSGDVFIAKYDTSGTRLWSEVRTHVTGVYPRGIVEDTQGKFVISGQTPNGASSTDQFIAKYDPLADSWPFFNAMGGGSTDVGYDLVYDASDNYYVVGHSLSLNEGTNVDVTFTKYNSSGVWQWTRTYGGTDVEYGYSIAKTTDGNFALTGTMMSYSPGSNAYEIMLVVLDSNGNIAGCSVECLSPTVPTSALTTSASAISGSATNQSPTINSYTDPGTESPRVTTVSQSSVVITVVVPGVGIGAPLAAQNIPYDRDNLLPLNLRVTVSVNNIGLAAGTSFKLQYADRAAYNACSAVPDGSFNDVSTNTAVYFVNGSEVSGAKVAADANDPTDVGRENVAHTYQEANPFTSMHDTYAGQNGLWQFSLGILPGTLKGKSYCLRIVHSTGTALGSYATFGELAYAPTMTRLMKGGKWFDSSGVKRPLAL